MFCRHCGEANQDGAFCSACGNRLQEEQPMAGGSGEISMMATGMQAPRLIENEGVVTQPSPYDAPPVAHQQVTAPATPSGNGFAIASIILGSIAFLFFPVILGPLGIIFGAIAVARKQKAAAVGLTLSIIGTVVGMIVGALVTGMFFL